MKQLARYLNGLHVVGLPKILAEKEAAYFRHLMGDIDQHFALVNTHFPKFDRALEVGMPLQLRGRLADRKTRNRYQQAAVYLVWMAPDLAAQLCRLSEKMETPPLLLPHRVILDQLGIGNAEKDWLSAEDGLHHLLDVMGGARLLDGRFFDQDRLWRYATDWPYAVAGLVKLIRQLHRWSQLNTDEQAQCHALFWAVSLCLQPQEGEPLSLEVLQSEWGLTSRTALAFQRAYAAQMSLPEGLFAPPCSFVKGSSVTTSGTEPTPACSESLFALVDQETSLVRAHLAAALLAVDKAHEAPEALPESSLCLPLPLPTMLTRLSQLPERLIAYIPNPHQPSTSRLLKISPQSYVLRAWPLSDGGPAAASPLSSIAVEGLLAELAGWFTSHSKHQSQLALWACWVYEVCVQLDPFAAVLRQHGLLTASRQNTLDALKALLLAFGRAPGMRDVGVLQTALRQWQGFLAPVISEVQGVTVLEDREARLAFLDTLRGVLDHFGQALIKLMFSLEAESRAQGWAALAAADHPTLPTCLPDWISPELSMNIGALRGRLAEQSAEQALMLFPVLAQEVDAARQHILSAQARRETLVDEALSALHAQLSDVVARFNRPLESLEPINESHVTPEPSASHSPEAATLQKQLDESKKRLHDCDRELQKQQKELTEKRIEAARLKQECQRLEKAQVGPLYLPGGQTMSALAEGLVRTMPDSQPRLSLILKAAAQFCHGQVEVLDSAYKSAQAYQRVEYSPTEVMDKLLRLCLEYLPRFMAGGDNKAREVFGQIYSAKESDSVMNDVRMRSQREFVLKGKKELFVKHLRLNSYLRLYFEVDQKREKIIIAYLGEHLDCAITA